MPPPPPHGHCWCAEPCQCEPCRCAPPPPPHGKKMPPPPPHCKKMPPPPPHGHCWCAEPCQCEPCRCAPPPHHAADVVARMASGRYNLCPCPGCERGERCQRHRPQSAGDRGRSGSRHGGASRSASSGPLSAPKYGRKVFITDDAYLARRAEYMAAWEDAGALRPMGPSSRSPSAALPEKTPKWRTTEVDTDDEYDH